jgi:hypothetical protein
MFGPGSLTWSVNGEAVLLLGGGRALILQVAHPKVAAGVTEFSGYREDPWGRLYRTLEVTLKIAFGDPETSRAASEGLRRIHGRVAGTDDRREPYRALDPGLLLWVHATLTDTSLTIYERYVGKLTPRERSLYYEEMKTLGEAYSIPRDAMPADHAAFRRYWASMLADGLRVTEATREVGQRGPATRSAPGRLAGNRGDQAGHRGNAPRAPARRARAGLGTRTRALARSLAARDPSPDARPAGPLSPLPPRSRRAPPGGLAAFLARTRDAPRYRRLSCPFAVRRRRGIPAASVSAASISARIAFSEREATTGSESPST